MVDGAESMGGAVDFSGIGTAPRALYPGGQVESAIAAEVAGVGVWLQSGLHTVGIDAVHLAAPVTQAGSYTGGKLEVCPYIAAGDDIGESVAGLNIKVDAGQAIDAYAGFKFSEETFLVIVVGNQGVDFLGGAVGYAIEIASHETLQPAVAESVADFGIQVGEDFLADAVAKAGCGDFSQNVGCVPDDAVFTGNTLVKSASEEVAVRQNAGAAQGGVAVVAEIVAHAHASHLVVAGVYVQVHIPAAGGAGCGDGRGSRCSRFIAGSIGDVLTVAYVVGVFRVFDGAIGDSRGHVCCQ